MFGHWRPSKAPKSLGFSSVPALAFCTGEQHGRLYADHFVLEKVWLEKEAMEHTAPVTSATPPPPAGVVHSAGELPPAKRHGLRSHHGQLVHLQSVFPEPGGQQRVLRRHQGCGRHPEDR